MYRWDWYWVERPELSVSTVWDFAVLQIELWTWKFSILVGFGKTVGRNKCRRLAALFRANIGIGVRPTGRLISDQFVGKRVTVSESAWLQKHSVLSQMPSNPLTSGDFFASRFGFARATALAAQESSVNSRLPLFATCIADKCELPGRSWIDLTQVQARVLD
jgi:hypothetical protein